MALRRCDAYVSSLTEQQEVQVNRNIPAVSVIIPVYNVEAYLEQCVDSVLSQSFDDFEIILVDDESPDGSGEICERYAASDTRVSVVHKKNGGLGYARNTGLEKAVGRYVFFLDSDDYLPADALERLYALAVAHGADVVHGRLNRFVQPGRFSATVRGGDVKVIRGRDALRHSALCYFSMVDESRDIPYAVEGSACAALYDRAFLKRNRLRFLSERDYISEDYIFNYECSLKAACICQSEDTVYHYRVNPQSLTRAPKSDVMRRVISYCKAVEDMFARDGFPPGAAYYAMGYAMSRVRAQYKDMFTSDTSFAGKMEWARSVRNDSYFDRILRNYPSGKMPRLHKINYRLFMRRRMLILYMLILLQQRIRRLTGYIG